MADRPASEFDEAVEHRLDAWRSALDRRAHGLRSEESGMIISLSEGVAQIEGLPGVGSEEVVLLGGRTPALALDLREASVGAAVLGEWSGFGAGDRATRTGQALEIPVGGGVLGRVLNPLGEPLDGEGAVGRRERRPVERDAPAIMDRAPVEVPLKTGVKAIDALIPIGRGQRQLIVGDRQIGKTAIALDAVINQRDQRVACVYCAIGQRASSVAGIIEGLRAGDALEHTCVISTTEEDAPGLRYVAPYAAMTIAEWFMEQGRDALVIFDDLTRHARAYRELALLLRRPPGREAYPGDIFYVHSRLLERSTRLKDTLGGGSVTALPIIETQAQNISAYIPTNLISITDGQVYLSPDLFSKGVLPAIDVGRSVSRVGGKTQLPAYRAVAGDLRLAYSQFEELEAFSRFASRLDEGTRATLERGRRVREALKQPRAEPVPMPEQVAALLAVNEGLLDEIALEDVGDALERVRRRFRETRDRIAGRILDGDELDDDDKAAMLETARDAIGRADRRDGGEGGDGDA